MSDCAIVAVAWVFGIDKRQAFRRLADAGCVVTDDGAPDAELRQALRRLGLTVKDGTKITPKTGVVAVDWGDAGHVFGVRNGRPSERDPLARSKWATQRPSIAWVATA